jgi:omega-6 fatty acid desaturase (delta-12 desaturase)
MKSKKKMGDRTFIASNRKAFVLLIVPTILLLGALWLLQFSYFPLRLLGHLCMSIFFTQCFILVHECGHQNFFRGQKLNRVMGSVFGFLSGIPYFTWIHMHNLHHKWTGWRDLDPTTEKTIKPSKFIIIRGIVNVAWFLCIPIFFLGYMFSNYWNLSKIKRFLKPAFYKKAVIHVFIYLGVYASVLFVFGGVVYGYFLVGFLLSLVWKELIILTQHSHIEIPLANGMEVKPISYIEQIKYTRSFTTLRCVSTYFLFNFNYHEAHHAQPGLPCYYLPELKLPTSPKSYFHWLKHAKSMSGNSLVFKTSKDSGLNF